MNFTFKATFLWGLIGILGAVLLAAPVGAITTKEEEEIGKEFLHMALKQYQVIDDPEIAGYVKKVGEKVLTAFPEQPFKYHFYVVNEEVYNAFAGPAGHIFIHSGLLAALQNEEELAGVLGHEISHVTCRHLSKMIKKSKTTSLATLAGVAAGIFLGASGAGAAGSALAVGSMAAGQSLSLSYSRENELQADQIALQTIGKAGYSGNGLLDSLKIIRSKNWYGTEIPSYLMTHPAVEDRMAYIGSYVASHEEHQKIRYSPESTDIFNHMKTRLIAHYGNEDTALRTFKTKIQENPDDIFAQYGYGVALARTGDRKSAIQYLQLALAKKPFDSSMVDDLGRVYYLDGQYEKALKMLKTATSTNVFSPETLLYLGRTQAELGHYPEAIATFETIIAQKPTYAQAYYHLGEAFGKSGQLGNAHYNLGLYYVKKEDWKNAIFHLKKASKLSTDPVLIQESEKILGSITMEEPSPEELKNTPEPN